VINTPAIQDNYILSHCVKKTQDNWLHHPIKHRKYSQKEDTLVIPQTMAMQRGIIIHRLFELLLDLPDLRREEAALTYLRNQQIVIEDLPLQEILLILQSEILIPFCQGQAVAEMEIAAPDGNLRRLDRVVVSNGIVKILDFKTSAAFPREVTSTPTAILDQLAGYATVMQQIYPEHQIECYLLWTAGPVLHYVPETMLCADSIKSLSSIS
jgi:ATP-dependent helicase/nuclease subunit A